MMKEINRRVMKGTLEQQYIIKKEMRRTNNYVSSEENKCAN